MTPFFKKLALFALTKEERDKIPDQDFAQPPDGFPCDTQAHLNAVAVLIGKEPEAEQPTIKKRAIAIAKRKGLELPDTWQHKTEMGAVQMGAFSMAAFGEPSGEYVPWGPCPIFEAGEYPAQGVKADESYLDRLAAGFKKAPLRDTHDEVQSVFAGRLGWADKVFRQGSTLMGSGMLHRGVHLLLGGDVPKASIEIEDKAVNPRLTGIALLNFPQVPTATVQAAFAAFAAAQYSAADVDDVQAIHDRCSAVGADCTGVASMGASTAGRMPSLPSSTAGRMPSLPSCTAGRMPALPAALPGADAHMGSQSSSAEAAAEEANDAAKGAQAAAEGRYRMSIKDRIMAYFGKADPKALEADGITAADIRALETAKFQEPGGTPAIPAPPALDPAIAAQIKALEERDAERAKQLAAFEAQNLASRARAFALDWKNRHKITEAERPEVEQLFIMAARADGGGTAKFEASGAIHEGEHVKVLTKAMEKRRELAIFETAIPGGSAATPGNDHEQRAQQSLKTAVEAYNR